MTDANPKTALDRDLDLAVRWLESCTWWNSVGEGEYESGKAREILCQYTAAVLEHVVDQMSARSPDHPLTAGELEEQARRLRGGE